MRASAMAENCSFRISAISTISLPIDLLIYLLHTILQQPLIERTLQTPSSFRISRLKHSVSIASS